MRIIIFFVLLGFFGFGLSYAKDFELTDSEEDSRDSLLDVIPIGSIATEGKELLEQNSSQCFITQDKDYLNNEKLNYIYCISMNTSNSNSISERWQIILYHDNNLVKGIKVKYENLE